MDIICKEFKDERILWRIFYGLNKTVGSGKLHQSDLRGPENSWKSWNCLESIEVSCKELKNDVKFFIKTMEKDIGQDDIKIPQFKRA